MTVTETQKQTAIDAINDLCQSTLEYETSHKDSGDNYAHLVGESWCNQKTRDMVDELLREKFDSSELPQFVDHVDRLNKLDLRDLEGLPQFLLGVGGMQSSLLQIGLGDSSVISHRLSDCGRPL